MSDRDVRIRAVGMKSRLFILVALTIGLCLVPAGADAKITCADGGAPTADIEVGGLPGRPEAARTYPLMLDLPRRHAVNPDPLLLILRCEIERKERHHLAGAESNQIAGVDTGEGAYSFDVRFERPGRWRMVAMDRSGLFHDLGFLRVASPVPNGLPEETDGSPAPLLIAIAGLAAGSVAALVAWRRRA